MTGDQLCPSMPRHAPLLHKPEVLFLEGCHTYKCFMGSCHNKDKPVDSCMQSKRGSLSTYLTNPEIRISSEYGIMALLFFFLLVKNISDYGQ